MERELKREQERAQELEFAQGPGPGLALMSKRSNTKYEPSTRPRYSMTTCDVCGRKGQDRQEGFIPTKVDGKKMCNPCYRNMMRLPRRVSKNA